MPVGGWDRSHIIIHPLIISFHISIPFLVLFFCAAKEQGQVGSSPKIIGHKEEPKWHPPNAKRNKWNRQQREEIPEQTTIPRPRPLTLLLIFHSSIHHPVQFDRHIRIMPISVPQTTFFNCPISLVTSSSCSPIYHLPVVVR